MSPTIAYILTPITCLTALLVGWWLRARRFGALGLTDEQIIEMVNELQKIQAGMVDGLGTHTRRIEQINSELAVNQNGDSGAAVDPIASGLFEQILEANETLNEQLAQAERKIRDMRAEIGLDESGRVDAPRVAPAPEAAQSPSRSAQNDSAAAAASKAYVPATDHRTETTDDHYAGSSPLPVQDEIADSATGDSRLHARRSLMKEVLLAPFVEGTIPGPDDIRPVKGYDISEGGIAFCLPNPPTHDAYVVVLGNAPNFIYMKVRVAHVAKRHMYIVGCQFVGRLAQPAPALVGAASGA